MVGGLLQRVARNRFALLLAILVLSLAMHPLAQHIGQGHTALITRLLLSGALVLLLGSAYLAVCGEHVRLAAVGIVLAILAAGSSIARSIENDAAWCIASDAAVAAALAYFIIMISWHFFTTRAADVEMMSAAICVYLMVGMTWAHLYSLADVLIPDAFMVHGTVVRGIVRIDDSSSGLALYYSFVTLSTLGYGDIAPAAPLTRMLAAAEAVAGPMYLAIVVARLVGVHIAGSGYDPDSQRRIEHDPRA